MSEELQQLPTTSIGDITSRGCSPSSTSLKRSASPPCDSEPASRKRLKEESAGQVDENLRNSPTLNCNLLEELAAELQCGCCSELVYRPVLVTPCQHFFCGSCCYLWIRNGGTNCPACRGVSESTVPFRPLQALLDALLRAAPHKARTHREREQADEVYTGQTLRIPKPKEASPGPDFNQSADFARPCPYCHDNPTGYRCPQPIPDPVADPAHAWHLDNGVPPGHAHCGNCENLLALHAPTTSKCDLCQVSFCGVSIQGRCMAASLLSQHPHNLSDIGDLIQSSELYECFDGNTVEVEIMFDYLTAQRLTPRHIYREIVTHIQSQPRGFQPLIETDLFSDVHGVAAGIDPDPNAPRNRICRVCAAEVLLYGLKDWWIRERQKGFLEETVLGRQDCPDGSNCTRQKFLAHAREFNHIIPSKSSEPSQQSHESNTAFSGAAGSVTPSAPPVADPDPQNQPDLHVPSHMSNTNNPAPFVIDGNPSIAGTSVGSLEPGLVDSGTPFIDDVPEPFDTF